MDNLHRLPVRRCSHNDKSTVDFPRREKKREFPPLRPLRSGITAIIRVPITVSGRIYYSSRFKNSRQSNRLFGKVSTIEFHKRQRAIIENKNNVCIHVSA